MKKMNSAKFKTYTTDDFILDEDFRKLIKEAGSNNRLSALLEELPEKKEEINLAVQILSGLHSHSILQDHRRKQELWQQILHTQSKRALRPLYWRIAASLLLLIGFGSAVFYLTNQRDGFEIIAENELPSNDARLILSDGKAVVINGIQSTVQYDADGSRIMVNDSSGIALPVADDGLNQMIVPYGKQSNILLADGTRIWLNSGSKLVFPSAFKGNIREVFLEGEALFDVSQNKEKPFYVKTDAFRMKVYGTKFNVQAYLQDRNYSIVLVEGKVSLNANESLPSREVFLAPNQKATISKEDQTIEVSEVENTEFYTAWLYCYLIFQEEDLNDILKRVSRYYNVPIETDVPDNFEKIYGKLDLKDDLERVLDGIAFISKTKYEKQENKYVFTDNLKN